MGVIYVNNKTFGFEVIFSIYFANIETFKYKDLVNRLEMVLT